MNTIQQQVGKEVIDTFLLGDTPPSEFLTLFSSEDIAKLRDTLSLELVERESKQQASCDELNELSTHLERYQVQVFKMLAHLNPAVSSKSPSEFSASDPRLDTVSGKLQEATALYMDYKDDATTPIPVSKKNAPVEVFSAQQNIATLLRTMANRIEAKRLALPAQELVDLYDDLHDALIALNDEMSVTVHSKALRQKALKEVELWVDMALELIKTQLSSDAVLSPEVIDKLMRKRAMVSVEGEYTTTPNAKSQFKGFVYRAMVNGELKRWNGLGKPPAWVKQLWLEE